MRRSTVLSPPLQLVFLVWCHCILKNAIQQCNISDIAFSQWMLTQFGQMSLAWKLWHLQNLKKCEKIGFLPGGLWHIRIKVSSTDLWEDFNRWCHLLLIQKIKQQVDASCCLGVPWKVPWYSAKRIFWNILLKFHGDYLKRWLLTHRVSQILLLTRLIS